MMTQESVLNDAISTAYIHLSSVPLYHLLLEAGLVVWIIWLMFRKSYRPSELLHLTDKEKEDLIADWTPEPLVPDTPQDHPALHPVYINGKLGKYVDVDGRELLNLATLNFLGLVADERIEETAKQAIFKYGVGSCGPRGFYGTVDVHLNLERELAEFMGCEEAVLYSYGFATVASAIPAYAKRGDVIFVDKGVNFAIQKGLQASRARIEWFEHNDVNDLERLLIIQAEKDKQNPKKAKVTRRFLVVEGIFMNSGQICPLPQLMALKWKYKVRIFIDESISFGVLGEEGKGVTQHFNVPIEDVDMICASLEYAVASTGGFCCGRSYVVDHQRLSGLGYCFSASLPPLLAAAASRTLNIMQEEKDRFTRLNSNSCKMLTELKEALSNTNFHVGGWTGSPLLHIKYSINEEVDDDSEWKRNQKIHAGQILDRVVEKARSEGFAITRARYLDKEEYFAPEPSIRITVNSNLVESEIKDFAEHLKNICKQIQ